MAISKDKKQQVVSQVKTLTEASPAVVFVNFHGLSVAAATELRQALKQAGLTYVVAKKTLIKLALADLNLSGQLPALEGEVALTALSSNEANIPEAIAIPKAVYDWQKKYPDNLKIIGGIFEGQFTDQATMTALAQIPGREVLLGQLVWMLNWPIQSLAITLNQAAGQRS